MKEGNKPVGLLSSLEEFKQVVEKMEVFSFTLEGREMSIEFRRLMPSEQAEIDAVYNFGAPDWRLRSMEVQPPRKPDGGFDVDDVPYLKALNQKAIEARAMALYRAVPIFRDGEELKDRNEIVKRVQSLGTDYLIGSIHNKVMTGGLEVIERANFTIDSEPAG